MLLTFLPNTQILSENLTRLAANYFATKHYLYNEVWPAIERDLQDLNDLVVKITEDEKNNINTTDIIIEDDQEIYDWIHLYRQRSQELLRDISTFSRLDSDKRNDELNLVLGLVCKEFVSDVGPNKVENLGSPLSTKSIQYCTANPNVGCTLVGMKTPEYVHDALAATEASKRLTKDHLNAIEQY